MSLRALRTFTDDRIVYVHVCVPACMRYLCNVLYEFHGKDSLTELLWLGKHSPRPSE